MRYISNRSSGKTAVAIAATFLKVVNEAIAEAIDSGKMGEFVMEANDLANGEIIEGLLDQ